jgi:excisionase family DNA binding protein
LPRPRKLLTSADVARAFRVDYKTVGRWVKAGRLTAVRTPGNQLRFDPDVIDKLLSGDPDGDDPS